MERVETDIVVAGAGVLGLAIARELALRGLGVVILEAEPKIGMGVSSRNSEVIHAGLYYELGSLKARFCVSGNPMLYAYARQKGIQHKNPGKLIVAEADGVDALAALQKRGAENGVKNIRLLSAKEAEEMQDQVLCAAALHVPSTGMINTHHLMEHFYDDAKNAGAILCANTRVVGGARQESFWLIEAETEIHKGEKNKFEVACRFFINAAGLGAQELSKNMGLPLATIPEQILGKGNYFRLAASRQPFTMPIYPLPKPGSLGLHTRQDFDGQTVFGPNLEIVDHIDYNVNMACLPEFEMMIRSYWRDAAGARLEPYYAGIRPKIKTPPGQYPDFVVQGPQQHGASGFFALYGIESPGLTSSMALAYALAEQIAPLSASTGDGAQFPYPLM